MRQRLQTMGHGIGLLGLTLVLLGAIGASSASTPAIQVEEAADAIRFRVQEAGAESAQVAIFNLAGRSIYRSAWTDDTTLRWPMTTDAGDRVANGVMLYQVRTRDAQGRVQAHTGKLALLAGELQASRSTSSSASGSNGDAVASQQQTINQDLRVAGQIRIGNGNNTDKSVIELDRSDGSPGAMFKINQFNEIVFNGEGGTPRPYAKMAWLLNQGGVFGVRGDENAEPLFQVADTGEDSGQVTVGPDALQGGTNQNVDLRVKHGHVGIGEQATDPGAPLVVRDSSSQNLIEAYNDGSGSAQGLVFKVERATGNVAADGSVTAASFQSGSGADVAERIETTEPLEPGDVVAIDPDRPAAYRQARGKLSRRVAGVVSTSPGIALGDRSTEASRDQRPLLALSGRVPVKVTAAHGPVEVGDLLVASSMPGYAMPCPAEADCTGAVVAKAMEPLAEGTGQVTAQVMLR